jgi:hypothetical protein
MTLLNTLLFSLGIVAIAAPLWVHLRLGRVRKRAKVSSLHLMLAARQTSRTPRKIVNWPLLLLRCLILLLLALGFGRLLLPLLGSGGTHAYAVFLVDVSGSMNAREGGKPVWEDAHGRLVEALEALDPSSKVAIVPSPLGGYRPQWEGPAEALARVEKLVPGAASNRLVGEMREGVRLLAEMPDDHPKVMHLISDFQRSAFSGVDQLALPSNIELRLDKVGPQKALNRGVTVSVLAAGATDIGLYAFNDGTGGPVEMIENGKSEVFTIAPGQIASRLTREGAKEKWVSRKLVLAEEDALAPDNTAYDVFVPQDPIPVWLYEPRGEVGQAAAEPAAVEPRNFRRGAPLPEAEATEKAVEHLYDQASYHLSAALQPTFAGETHSESRFQPRLLTAGTVAAALGELENPGAPRLLFVPATAVVPAELGRLAEALTARGGAVVFFSGPELKPDAYQAAFGPLLPVAIGAGEELTLKQAMANIDERHALWGGLDAQTRRQLATVKLRSRSALELVKGAKALAYFSDAKPLIAERLVGPGRAYFVNTTADRGWSDWAADPPLFVPGMHLLAARALGLEAFAPADEPFLAGERGTLTLDPADAGKKVRVGAELLGVDPKGNVAVTFPTPGIFDLAFEDGSAATRVAVNFPPTESVLDSYAQTVALQRLESLRQAGTEAAVRWEGNMDEGGLAWKLCLALAAMLLLVEPVMANTRVKA